MTGARFAARVALAAAALSLMMLAVAVGVGQGQSASPAQTTTAPSQLTQEYPLGAHRLCCGEKGAAGASRGSAANRPAAARDGGPDNGGSMLWLLLLAPLAVLVFLVWLVAYARSGPPTAYGYALGNEPRRRRRVPASVITVLTPLFAYNHHRDAYILRGIGSRRGPVLKLRSADTDSPAVRPANVRPAAAPLGARGVDMAARLVREPRAVANPAAAPAARPAAAPRPRRTAARAKPNGAAPANDAPTPTPAPTGSDTPAKATRPKAKPKSGKGKATKKTKTATTAKSSKNGKGKKTSPAPRAKKPKAKPVAESAPSLTDALATDGKSRSARAQRRADYRARQGGGAGSTERDAGSAEERSAPTGRFKRDESKAGRDDRPAGKTRK